MGGLLWWLLLARTAAFFRDYIGGIAALLALLLISSVVQQVRRNERERRALESALDRLGIEHWRQGVTISCPPRYMAQAEQARADVIAAEVDRRKVTLTARRRRKSA
jgi:hypothetical protein